MTLPLTLFATTDLSESVDIEILFLAYHVLKYDLSWLFIVV
jgi:hypothetical protein